MYKLANQVLDAHDDLDRSILRKVAQKDPSIYMLTNDEYSELSDDDFALSVITKKAHKINKFPIDSKDSTWLSNEYFNETCNRLTKEAAEIAAYHIKSACDKFGVKPTPAVEGMAKEASTNVYFEVDMPSKRTDVVAEDMSKFAKVKEIGDNYTFAQFAFNTPEAVKTACDYFKQYSAKMPVEYRAKYAAAIQKRAGELGVKVTEAAVCKYASNSYSAHLDAHLSTRREILQVKEAKYTSALNKLASMKNEMSPMEFAQVLHGFDKRAGIDRYYGGYLTNPYEATFSGLSNPEQVKVGSAKSMTPAELGNLFSSKYAKIKEYFGSSIADSLKKEGQAAFEALPNDAKELIAGIADGTL
jgi:hypothetical protein